MKRQVVASALIFLGVLVLATAWAFKVNLQNGFKWTCDIVQEAYYKKSPELEDWRLGCRELTDEVNLGTTKAMAIDLLNAELAELRISHLAIYSDDKDKEMWENTSLDNGLRVRVIDGAFIVMSVVPNSSADEAGLQPGDEITKVGDESPRSAYDLRSRSGEFEIKRLEKGELQEYSAVIVANELTEDLSPSLKKLSNQVALLKIGSFLPQYFEKEEWKKISSQLSSFDHVIIDTRENSGGSFVGMLRALSPFFCEPTKIGLISSAAKLASDFPHETKTLVDDLEAKSQIEQLQEDESLQLKTFRDYGCTRAKTTVLVDTDTASTAEIFAYALMHRKNSRVWGVPTAGEVVVARWYDLSPIGFDGYSLSVPIAGFITNEGTELESEGVTPEKLLFYKLDDARLGRDTWVNEALKSVSK